MHQAQAISLKDKVVVVTGAGSGIGRALAIGFSRDGARVVGFGRKAVHLEETAAQCGGGGMHSVVGDLAMPADIDRLFAETDARFGRVDILVNNAALYPSVAFLADSPAEWSNVIQVNVVAMAHCCRAVLPGMLQRGFGRILNVGSFAWKGPIPNSSSYTTSKAAVAALTRCIAVEIDRTTHPDVLVNEFLPGSTRTGMSSEGADPMDVYPHARYVATLPAHGPHGAVFERSSLIVEGRGLRRRAREWLGGLMRGASI